MTARTVRLTGNVSDGGLVQVAKADGTVEWILLEGKAVQKITPLPRFSGSVEFHISFVDGTVEFYLDGTVELPDE